MKLTSERKQPKQWEQNPRLLANPSHSIHVVPKSNPCQANIKVARTGKEEVLKLHWLEANIKVVDHPTLKCSWKMKPANTRLKWSREWLVRVKVVGTTFTYGNMTMSPRPSQMSTNQYCPVRRKCWTKSIYSHLSRRRLLWPVQCQWITTQDKYRTVTVNLFHRNMVNQWHQSMGVCPWGSHKCPWCPLLFHKCPSTRRVVFHQAAWTLNKVTLVLHQAAHPHHLHRDPRLIHESKLPFQTNFRSNEIQTWFSH